MDQAPTIEVGSLQTLMDQTQQSEAKKWALVMKDEKMKQTVKEKYGVNFVFLKYQLNKKENKLNTSYILLLHIFLE